MNSVHEERSPITRIVVATAGRFHVLDLARELDALGYSVKFFSYVPQKRARKFGLPARCHVGLAPYLLPLLAWMQWWPRLASGLRDRLLWWALNRLVIWKMSPCEVFICMSGIYLEAAKYAKRRYGAIVMLHRGSQHILSQAEILKALPAAEQPSEAAIRRELDGYGVADVIAIPSKHVHASFERDPAAHVNCVVNPYGVNLDLFPQLPTVAHVTNVVFVYAGMWSYRKGCDLLAAAIGRVEGARLLHVGDIVDCPFPSAPAKFIHLKKVNQAELSGLYTQCHAFVLASREDGFGVVLSQALASGLPVLCTDRTGGPDLKHTPALADRIHVIESDNLEALIGGLEFVAHRLRSGPAYPTLTPKDRASLTWTEYARRYADNMELVLAKQRTRNSARHAPGSGGPAI